MLHRDTEHGIVETIWAHPPVPEIHKIVRWFRYEGVRYDNSQLSLGKRDAQL